MMATVATSPRHSMEPSSQVARALLGKASGRRRSLPHVDTNGKNGRGEGANSDAPEAFLRREASLDAQLQYNGGSGASPRQAGEAGGPALERGGVGGGSLSLDFLRRESSLEALRFITSSPGKFGLDAGSAPSSLGSRGVR